MKTIKLYETFINEANAPKITIKDAVITFAVSAYENSYIFLVKTSKDLDKLEDVDEDDITRNIIEFANSKFKDVKFIINNNYLGVGYALVIDTNSIITKLK